MSDPNILVPNEPFHRKLNFLEKNIFGHFSDSIGYIKESFSTNKFCVDSRYEIISF